jgi:hypothetical protein
MAVRVAQSKIDAWIRRDPLVMKKIGVSRPRMRRPQLDFI